MRSPPSGVASILSSARPFTSIRCARRFDLELHQVEQIGAACDELGALLARCGRRSLGRRVRALVGEGLHALPPGDLGDRIDDVGIGAAAADVAAHALADLGSRRLRRRRQVGAHMARNAGLDLVEHRNRRADLPGRAVAALIAVMLHEGGLHRVQVVGRAQPLDGGDAVALVHDRQREARRDPPPVDDHGARAALALIAPLLGAGEVQVLAQRVEQRRPRVELELAGYAVHRERDLRDGSGFDNGSLGARAAWASAVDGTVVTATEAAVPINKPRRDSSRLDLAFAAFRLLDKWSSIDLARPASSNSRPRALDDLV